MNVHLFSELISLQIMCFVYLEQSELLPEAVFVLCES